MAHSPAIQKTLVMKPEVDKIFDDLEAWHDICRFEMIGFNPADLYKSKEYFALTGTAKTPRPYKGKNPKNLKIAEK